MKPSAIGVGAFLVVLLGVAAVVESSLRCDVCNPLRDHQCDSEDDYGKPASCLHSHTCQCDIVTKRDKQTDTVSRTYWRKCGPLDPFQTESCEISDPVDDGTTETQNKTCTCNSDSCRACDIMTHAPLLTCYVCHGDDCERKDNLGMYAKICKPGDKSCEFKTVLGTNATGHGSYAIRRSCSTKRSVTRTCTSTVETVGTGTLTTEECSCNTDKCNDMSDVSPGVSSPALALVVNFALALLFKS